MDPRRFQGFASSSCAFGERRAGELPKGVRVGASGARRAAAPSLALGALGKQYRVGSVVRRHRVRPADIPLGVVLGGQIQTDFFSRTAFSAEGSGGMRRAGAFLLGGD